MTLPFASATSTPSQPSYVEEQHKVKYMPSERITSDNLNNLKPIMLKMISTSAPELFERLIEAASDYSQKDTDPYIEAQKTINTINKYVQDVTDTLHRDGRDNYDMMYAAQYISQHVSDTDAFPDIDDVRAELSQRSFKKPEIEYLETEEQRDARVERQNSDVERRRDAAAKENKVALLMPVDTERSHKVHRASLSVTSESLSGMSRHFTGRHDAYSSRQIGLHDISTVNGYIKAAGAIGTEGATHDGDSLDV